MNELREDLIDIDLRLFATLRELFPPEERGQRHMKVPNGTTIDKLIDIIGIKDRSQLILLVNGRPSKDFNRIILDGDRVAFFPPVGGG